MKKTLFFSLVVALILVLGACSDKAGGSNDGSSLEGEFVTVLTGGSSGVYFPLGGAMAKIYQEMGANANSQSTAASAANITTLNKGDAEVGFSMGDAAEDGYNGVDSFEEQGAQEDIRSIASLYPNYLQIVATADSGIKTIEDLKDKNVAVGAPASGTEISAKRVLEAYGMSYDDINEDFLSFAEGVEGIKNGTIDAVVISSGLPNAGVMELQTTNEIVVVEIAEEIVLEMQKNYPSFFPATVGADVYGLDVDTPTIGVNNVLLTHSDVSDEVVYELTKGFYENLDTLKDTHNAAKDIDIQNALKNLPAPLHPGAKKYFDEQGISE